MSTRIYTRILILLLCSVVLFGLLHRPFTLAAPDVCQEEAHPTAGTQLPWESLSRQFVSAVQY